MNSSFRRACAHWDLLPATAFVFFVAATTVPERADSAAPKQRGFEGSQDKSEEKKFTEAATEIPAYPQESALMEFRPHGISKNRFFVDPASVSIGSDRAVRYTVVVKSPSGVANTSFEAMRCETAEYKVFSLGTRDGTWSILANPIWREIDTTKGGVRFRLFDEYFCDGKRLAGRTEKDLLRNLQDVPKTGFGENWQKKMR
ncbi:MAG: CNP1-like family protein [Burkholderiales bacterium]